jgi:ABC-2 type transport system permease protein
MNLTWKLCSCTTPGAPYATEQMKALTIAWKDTLIRFRDWKALAGMLAAPLLISALIGLAFGDLDTAETPIEDIAVALVNLDEGVLGQVYEDALNSQGLADLLTMETMADLEAAQERIEAGELRAVIYIPAGFSESLIPNAADGFAMGTQTVQVFTDPAAEISPFIVESIVEQISAGLNTALLAGQVSAAQVAEQAALLGPAMANLGQVLTQELAAEHFAVEQPRLDLELIEVGEASEPFDVYSFFVPGMAVFFLMFSMFDGSRSILQEQTRGTLPRLMTTPTPTGEIILGKIGGTFLSGLLQFGILVLASSVLFNVNWGSSPLGVITIMVLTVFAAAGLGALLTTFARNENQASIIASAVSLTFGALGGSFFPSTSLTGAVDIASRLTLNRWAMEGFTKLTSGGGFGDILVEAGVLTLIGLITFWLALRGFERRFVK